LEAGYLKLREVLLKRITVIKFGVTDGGGDRTCRGGIKVRTDTTKRSNSNMIIARFEKGRCLAGKSKMFIDDIHRR